MRNKEQKLRRGQQILLKKKILPGVLNYDAKGAIILEDHSKYDTFALSLKDKTGDLNSLMKTAYAT